MNARECTVRLCAGRNDRAQIHLVPDIVKIAQEKKKSKKDLQETRNMPGRSRGIQRKVREDREKLAEFLAAVDEDGRRKTI